MRSILAILAQRRHSEGISQRSGPDRREWWGYTRPRRRTPWGRCSQIPPTPAPTGGFRGPLRCIWGLPRAVGGCLVVPGIALPVYPPVPYPASTPLRWRRCTHHDEHERDGVNSCFGTLVGEPRGSGTQLVLGSQAGYIQLFEGLLVYTAV